MAKKHPEKTPLLERPAVQWGLGALIVVIIVALIAVIIYAIDARQDSVDGEILLTVNGQPVYADDVEAQYMRLPTELREQYTREIVLDQNVDKILILQEAERAGIKATKGQIDTRIAEQAVEFGVTVDQLKEVLEQSNVSFDEYREAVGEEIVLQRFVEEEILNKTRVSSGDVRAYYDDNIEDYSAGPGERRVRHVLVSTEEEALDVSAQARAGTDFAGLASEHSLDSSAQFGGDLGFVSNSSPLVEPFLQAALELEEGEVSGPVQTRFGWHIIMRDADAIPFEEVQGEIENTLKEEAAKERFQELLEYLRSEADIRIFSDSAGTLA